jgi:hypothetical protein
MLVWSYEVAVDSELVNTELDFLLQNKAFGKNLFFRRSDFEISFSNGFFS